MKVETRIKIHAVNGKDTYYIGKKELTVRNVWNQNKLVELQFDGGDAIIVSVIDLITAIENGVDNENK